MKVFSTVDSYLEQAKPGDIIVFGGRGILNGLNLVSSVYDTYKVHNNTTKDKLVIRSYKGRKNLSLGANYYEQEVALLSKEDYKNLNK
jgi:hypothetical protein